MEERMREGRKEGRKEGRNELGMNGREKVGRTIQRDEERKQGKL